MPTIHSGLCQRFLPEISHRVLAETLIKFLNEFVTKVHVFVHDSAMVFVQQFQQKIFQELIQHFFSRFSSGIPPETPSGIFAEISLVIPTPFVFPLKLQKVTQIIPGFLPRIPLGIPLGTLLEIPPAIAMGIPPGISVGIFLRNPPGIPMSIHPRAPSGIPLGIHPGIPTGIPVEFFLELLWNSS